MFDPQARADRNVIASAKDLSIAAASPFFADLDQDALHTVVNFCQHQRTEDKQCVVHQGEAGTHLYVVRVGQFRLYRKTKEENELLLRWLAPGDVFGLTTLLKNPFPYIGTAESMGDCEVWSWPHASIRGLADRYPQLAENALRIALLYLTEAAARYEGLINKSARERTADALLQLSHRAGQVFPHGVLVDTTNRELGALAHVSPSAVSKVLNGWRERGAIFKQGKQLILQCPEMLLAE